MFGRIFVANSDVCWDVPCRLPRAAFISNPKLHFFNELILQLQLFLNFNSNLSHDFINLLDFRKMICMRLSENHDVIIANSNLVFNHILECSNLANAPNSLLSLKHFSDCNFHMAAGRRGRRGRWWSHLRFLAENPLSPLCSSINLL